ncbi:MAG: FecR family protein [Thiohalospira sp.]
MKTNNINYWDLIAKYYAEECSDKEVELLDDWINQSEEHKNLFFQIKNDLEIINKNKAMERINVDSAWEKLKSRIEEEETSVEVEKEKQTTINLFRVLKYAAIVIFVAGLGFLSTKIYNEKFGNYLITETTGEKQVSNEIVLPDGTKVVLNAGSTLKYPETFADGNFRRVKLEGEAFFDVTKNQEKPFIIDAISAEIRVLGTSFNVKADKRKEVEVYVESGRVELSRKKSKKEKIIIDPGNVGVILENKISKQKNNNPNILAWKTKNIVFTEDKLSNVINVLSKIYHVEIRYNNDEILDYRLTSTFKNQDIESVIEVICVTFNLKVEYKNDAIILFKN